MAQMIFENNAWHLRDKWDIYDVRCVAANSEDGDHLTDEDCVRVLELVVEDFDANVGVNWEVIGAAVDVINRDKQGVMK